MATGGGKCIHDSMLNSVEPEGITTGGLNSAARPSRTTIAIVEERTRCEAWHIRACFK